MHRHCESQDADHPDAGREVTLPTDFAIAIVHTSIVCMSVESKCLVNEILGYQNSNFDTKAFPLFPPAKDAHVLIPSNAQNDQRAIRIFL